MDKPLILLGESTQIFEIRETCDLLDIKIHGIIDDDYYGNTEKFDDIPYIGSEKNTDWVSLKKDFNFFIPINPVPGNVRNIEKRKKFIDLVDELDLPCINIIDPECRVSPRARLGKGIFVGYHSYVAPNVTIGDHCQLHFTSGVMHDCVLGRNTILNRAAGMISHVTTGENVYIAPFAKIMNIHGQVGSNSIINAGLAVFRNIEPGEVVNIRSRKIYSAIADLPNDA